MTWPCHCTSRRTTPDRHPIVGDELLFQPLHINLIDGRHEWQRSKPIEGDLQPRLVLRLDAQVADDKVRVTLLPLVKHVLALVDSKAVWHIVLFILNSYSLLLVRKLLGVKFIWGDVLLHLLQILRLLLAHYLCLKE